MLETIDRNKLRMEILSITESKRRESVRERTRLESYISDILEKLGGRLDLTQHQLRDCPAVILHDDESGEDEIDRVISLNLNFNEAGDKFAECLLANGNNWLAVRFLPSHTQLEILEAMGRELYGRKFCFTIIKYF